MATKITRNRTKQVITDEGTARVVIDADESRMVVTGRIRWKGEELAAFDKTGVSRGALRDLAKAILEAVDASEWHEETAVVEPPAAKDDGLYGLADLGFAPRRVGDRNKDQAAPAGRPVADRPQA